MMFLRNICFGLLCMLLLAGCATSPATRFYTLSAIKTEEATQNFVTPKYRIVIGQATIPDTVNRAAIVTRQGDNRVQVHENHRWTESLKTEIPRVIALNLSALLPDAQVAGYPQRLALADADFDVVLDVRAFDAMPGKAVALDVQWRIQNRTDEKRTLIQHARLTEEVDGDGMAAVAAAFSRVLATLSEEMAAVVRSETLKQSDS